LTSLALLALFLPRRPSDPPARSAFFCVAWSLLALAPELGAPLFPWPSGRSASPASELHSLAFAGAPLALLLGWLGARSEGLDATRKKLAVRLEAPEAELPCSGDPDALSLVVANLFTNAVKYTHEGGAVTLGARALPGGGAEIFVSDNGIGVAPEDREKIFDGYYRAEEGKREAKGFGVGLALSRMILEAHGTDLDLETELGKGSRFSFRLRAYDKSGAADLRTTSGR